MKILVVGLGSMGKRRIRCLHALGENDVAGFDVRQDRRDEAAGLYGVRIYEDFRCALDAFRPEALVISTPPDKHHVYFTEAIRRGIPFFVEASVVDDGLQAAIEATRGTGLVAAPSATLLFHPAIRKVAEFVHSGYLGKISNVLLHSGQYLPDWHTYESPADFYVSNPATGAAREIVPFELSWFIPVFGWPKRVACNYRRTIDIPGAPSIDDTYNCLLDFKDFLAVITVDVVSRYATRRLVINGSEKQLVWLWDKNQVDIFNPTRQEWEHHPYEMAASAQGYNANIGENMYVDEVEAFLKAIRGEGAFVNTLEQDKRVLEVLYAAEEADTTGRFVDFA